MDDLQELRRFRADVPPPTDGEHEDLAQRIAADTASYARRPLARRIPRPSRRIWIPAVAAVLTAALVIGIGTLADRRDEPEPAKSKKSTILDEAADRLEAVASGPLEIPRDDQWRYKKTMHLSSEVGAQEDEDWVRSDFDQAAHYRGDVLRVSDGDGVDVNELLYFTDFTSMGELYEFFADLPEHPSAVLGRIYRIVDKDDTITPSITCRKQADCEAAWKEPWTRDYAAYHVIWEFLAAGVPPAEVQAKLFRAMREIPGVRDEGRADDTTSKEVLTVSWRPPFKERPDIVMAGFTAVAIDPDSSMFRGTLGYLLDPKPSETPVEAEIILDAGIVDGPGRFPTVLAAEAAHLDVHASQPVEVPAPDQWRYRKVAHRGGGAPEAKEEEWLRADYGRAAGYGDDQELRTHNAEVDTEVFADLAELSTFLQNLPDDPTAVADRVAAMADEHDLGADFECADRPGCEPGWHEVWSRHGATVDLIRVLLEEGAPPPDVQAKLFRALDEIPGIYNGGRDEDLTGADVHVISWKPAYIKDLDVRRTRTIHLLVDAGTHRYRGHRDFWTDADGGDLREFIVLDAGLVDRPGQRP